MSSYCTFRPSSLIKSSSSIKPCPLRVKRQLLAENIIEQQSYFLLNKSLGLKVCTVNLSEKDVTKWLRRVKQVKKLRLKLLKKQCKTFKPAPNPEFIVRFPLRMLNNK